MRYRTALVTGASKGIGTYFAAELAEAGTSLVLVARRVELLENLAGELRERFQVEVEVLPADLTDPDALTAVQERLADPERPVDLLVNNAGALTTGPFAQLPLNGEIRQLELNVMALVRLTHSALGPMVVRGRGGVVNVSSIAGEAPTPYSATYCAGYAFVTNFSQSVHLEVAEHGVHVTALLPGFTAPGADGPRIQHPRQVVREALGALVAGKPLCIPGGRNKAAAAFARLAPRGVVRSVMEGVASAGAPTEAARS